MAIKGVFILNRAGGLVFNRDFGSGLKKLDNSNDYLVIAGTLHSVHALSSRIGAPLIGDKESKCSGFKVIETPTASIHCFQTLTGLKFIVVTDVNQFSPQSIGSHLHQLYADYALKNPFYTLDMPIRCTKFDRKLEQYVQSVV